MLRDLEESFQQRMQAAAAVSEKGGVQDGDREIAAYC